MDDLCAAVRSTGRLVPVGGGSKPALSRGREGDLRVSMRGLSGIVEYAPGEFTFTARAGTPLREIVAALAAKGQYLPWDPPLVEAGATLGGTIAAGLSGAGRFRFGGLRDFILAVQFVDGEGRVLRAGAKVVKNAAGFDVPKFLCGSAGRFAVITEATFKVFPAPASRLTVRVPCESAAKAVERLAAAGGARWELEALDFAPAELAIYARLAGPADANAAVAGEVVAKWPEASVLGEDLADQWWADGREFCWAGEFLAKVPLTLGRVAEFVESLARIPGSLCRISAGGRCGVGIASRRRRCAFAVARRAGTWRIGAAGRGARAAGGAAVAAGGGAGAEGIRSRRPVCQSLVAVHGCFIARARRALCATCVSVRSR